MANHISSEHNEQLCDCRQTHQSLPDLTGITTAESNDSNQHNITSQLQNEVVVKKELDTDDLDIQYEIQNGSTLVDPDIADLPVSFQLHNGSEMVDGLTFQLNHSDLTLQEEPHGTFDTQSNESSRLMTQNFHVSLKTENSENIQVDGQSMVKWGMENYSNSLVYPCHACGKFKFTSLLVGLPRDGAETGKKEFKCIQCEKTFPLKTALQYHINVHLGLNPYACDKCPKKFAQPGNLITHKKKHHGKKPPYKKRAHQTLESYLAELEEREERYRYFCTHEGCKKKYIKKKDLVFHLQGHNGIKKRVECKQCHRWFANNGTLKTHFNTFHSEVKIKKENHSKQQGSKFPCDDCRPTKIFSTLRSLMSHKTNCHAERRFQCLQCENKRFINGSMLALHVRTVHNGEKSFQCNQCLKKFSQNCNLKVHMRLHSGVYPYECSLCPMRFAEKCNLDKHTKSQHANGAPSTWGHGTGPKRKRYFKKNIGYERAVAKEKKKKRS